ncbi:hypothetical protein ASF61_08520 [Duganella sp. Leaf126]|uniref:hypothetical protein n=1 Tax=Duganella sp. Leaf126 TaxID=1736266 RepID=UPI0006F28ED9|nr:hypothetical protein [Duganella sp. Leaf126]KQQ36222.1 hypothetical protein ASF61_08520 [Duganella sp. Leaf126]
MNTSEPTGIWPSVLAQLRLLVAIARLPRARLCFDAALNPELIRRTHASFTMPHPRLRIVRNKSLGVALIDLRAFADSAAYLRSVAQKDHAGYQARRARARGYTVAEIDRNDYIDDIHRINTSQPERQGRPMDAAYARRTDHYTAVDSFRYYGVLDAGGRLVAYCDLGIYGDFAATDRLLGYHSDGVMYLLLADIACRLIDERRCNYLMYDTYLGALPGLREFKRKLGFAPYRIRYAIA